jgi:dienelactone hydrolase
MLGTSFVYVDSRTLRSGDEADVYVPHGPLRHKRNRAYPLLAVLQGAFVDKSRYAGLGRALARRGFVVVIPNHFRPFPGFSEPVLFSEVNVVSDVLEAATEGNADPRSPLYRRVDAARMGLVGHSLGGSVGLYAIAGECPPGICSGDSYTPPPALRAAAVYGTSLFDIRSGALIELDTSRAAVALVQGSRDGIALPENASRSLPVLARPRALIEIDGANHYAVCTENNPLGAAADPNDSALSRRAGNAVAARWIALWLRARLCDDPLARLWIERIGRSFDGTVRAACDLGARNTMPAAGP